MDSLNGGATQQHCCCWPLAPSLPRSLACTDWRRLNHEKLPAARARGDCGGGGAGTAALAHTSTHPAHPPPPRDERTRTHQHRISPSFSSGPTKTTARPQPLVPRRGSRSRACARNARAPVRPLAGPQTDVRPSEPQLLRCGMIFPSS